MLVMLEGARRHEMADVRSDRTVLMSGGAPNFWTLASDGL